MKQNLLLSQNEVQLDITACEFAQFSGKVAFNVPDVITATLKDDSVLVFQSPAKVPVWTATSGNGTSTSSP